jgi:hypothetical protein
MFLNQMPFLSIFLYLHNDIISRKCRFVLKICQSHGRTSEYQLCGCVYILWSNAFWRLLSSGIQRHAARWKSTDFSKNQSYSSIYSMLISCLAYSSTLKMEATCYSEILIDVQPSTQRNIPEEKSLYNHRCGNLKYVLLHTYIYYKIIN